jgi:hypothetical protein
MEIDWNRSFMEQVNELFQKVPQRHTFLSNVENCDYCSFVDGSKNSYLTFLCYGSSDCLYSYDIKGSRDIVDSYKIVSSELIYESAHCSGCYNLKYSDHCSGCNSSAFLSHCIGCQDCFGCCNLRNKQYYVFNKPLSKEDYEQFIASADLGSFESVEKWRFKFEMFRQKMPLPPDHNSNCENVKGDYLVNCKNCIDCFSLSNSVDCQDCHRFWDLTECSATATGKTEIGLENMSGLPGYFAVATAYCYQSSYLTLCKDVWYSKHCLGSVGVRNGEYIILNKAYSKEEYAELSKRILFDLAAQGELGEFFPIEMTPFPYNHTLSQELFPLTKSEALSKGLKWQDEPDVIAAPEQKWPEIPDSIVEFTALDEPLICLRSNRAYQIIPQELMFYQKLNIPIPRLAPLTRMKDMIRFQPVYELRVNNCARSSFDGVDCHQTFSNSHVPALEEQKAVCSSCYDELIDQ